MLDLSALRLRYKETAAIAASGWKQGVWDCRKYKNFEDLESSRHLGQ